MELFTIGIKIPKIFNLSVPESRFGYREQVAPRAGYWRQGVPRVGYREQGVPRAGYSL